MKYKITLLILCCGIWAVQVQSKTGKSVSSTKQVDAQFGAQQLPPDRVTYEFSEILLQIGYRPLIRGSFFAEIVVFLSESVVFDKQVAEKSEDPIERPSNQPDNRSSRVVPLLVCLVDIHPPYRSKNEEICPAKSSWGVNCHSS